MANAHPKLVPLKSTENRFLERGIEPELRKAFDVTVKLRLIREVSRLRRLSEIENEKERCKNAVILIWRI